MVSGCPPTEPSEGVDAGTETVHEPLAMPATPTLNPEDFPGSASCAPCHPNQVAEWSTSSHAYAMIDPVFQALVEQRQRDLDGNEDQFCTQCHSAIGTRGGECVKGFKFAELSPIVMEGVTCVACHATTGVERPFNSGHRLDPNVGFVGPIPDPMPSSFHESRFDPEIQTSRFCAGCHDVVETSGLELERPYAEWLESPSNGAGDNGSATPQACHSCHMNDVPGSVAVGGPERGRKSHHFTGVGLPLAEGFLTADQRDAKNDRIEALLANAASVDLKAPVAVAPSATFDLVATITNHIQGHSLPTGTTFIRQVWLSVVATDAEGRILYRTGDLDANGDLKDVWSDLAPFGDPDLVTLSSRLIDADGEPTLFPWRASEHISSSLSPGHARTHTFFVPVPATAAGPVTIEAALKFRAMPPYLLRALGMGESVGLMVVRTIAQATVTVAVTAPVAAP